MPISTAQDYRRVRSALRFVTDNPVGEHYFVSSVTGSAGSGYGYTPDAPLTTIDAAVGLCTANKGDTIWVLPGHAETISAAAGIDLDVAGITVRGIGTGTLQPKVTLDTAITADVDVDAANITIENIHFTANFADITAAIDVNAQFCFIRGCRFSDTATDMNTLIWILGGSTTTSSGLRVEDCICQGVDAADTHFISLPGTDNFNIIRNNLLYGNWGMAAIGAAGNVVNIQIHGNLIYNAATDNDSCINIAAAGTGYISENYVTSGAAQANGITAAGCGKCNNFQGVNAEDLSALLDPILT